VRMMGIAFGSVDRWWMKWIVMLLISTVE